MSRLCKRSSVRIACERAPPAPETSATDAMNVYLLQSVNGIGVGMLYFLLAVGLSIVFGLLRFVNFAHGAFYLLGAYFCYQAMQWSMNFWTALVIVPIVVGALAGVVEKLVLR